ncbi:hypothetical protein M0R45_036401 [Rubus argutus]|uniref:Cysteine proteinase inhibitor n=1 Tax=Rubus argutus TaxID=59490 RepID=A0AAW1VYS3_RUBAR
MAAVPGGITESQGSENSAEIEDLARFAVQEHNKKEVVNTKQQVVAGTMYYLTIEATERVRRSSLKPRSGLSLG